jgi:hypothetical protein
MVTEIEILCLLQKAIFAEFTPLGISLGQIGAIII